MVITADNSYILFSSLFHWSPNFIKDILCDYSYFIGGNPRSINNQCPKQSHTDSTCHN